MTRTTITAEDSEQSVSDESQNSAAGEKRLTVIDGVSTTSRSTAQSWSLTS